MEGKSLGREAILEIIGKGGVELEAWKHERYEEKIVRILFSHYDLPRRILHELLNNAQEQDGRSRLTLEAFHDRFPRFPIRLEAREWPKIAEKCTVARCFNDFFRQQFVEEFVELEASSLRDVGVPFGLVVYWSWLKGPKRRLRNKRSGEVVERRFPYSGPNLVIHTAGLNTEMPGLRWLWVTPTKQQVVVEPLTTLLAGIKWELDE